MIKSSVAQSIGTTIKPSSQKAFQADSITPLAVSGETHITLLRDNKTLSLNALVVDDLDVDVLAGTPFMIANDISMRPAKYQVCMQGSLVIEYQPSKGPSSQSHTVRHAQCYVMRSSSPTTILWRGEFIEVDVPPDLEQDSIIAIEPRIDTCAWPQPQIVEAVGHKVRIENTSDEPE